MVAAWLARWPHWQRFCARPLAGVLVVVALLLLVLGFPGLLKSAGSDQCGDWPAWFLFFEFDFNVGDRASVLLAAWYLP